MTLRPDSFTCRTCGQEKPLSEFDRTPKGHRRKCRACRKVDRRVDYERNRERYIAKATQWNRDNRERHNEIRRARSLRPEVAEADRERLKVWRAANPEKWRAQQERALEVQRERGFPDAAKRRAVEREAFVEPVHPLVVLELDDGVCGICGEDVDPFDFHVDHIVPLSRGGEHSYANVQVAHPLCNREKSARMPW